MQISSSEDGFAALHKYHSRFQTKQGLGSMGASSVMVSDTSFLDDFGTIEKLKMAWDHQSLDATRRVQDWLCQRRMTSFLLTMAASPMDRYCMKSLNFVLA